MTTRECFNNESLTMRLLLYQSMNNGSLKYINRKFVYTTFVHGLKMIFSMCIQL